MNDQQYNKPDTEIHINRVRELLIENVIQLLLRTQLHDKSKLLAPEEKVFDEYTPKSKNSIYGSDEYKEFLKNMEIALKHHYSNNQHHPEHFENGINDMNLIDLIEMLCDWKAATERHDTGDILKILEINKNRFKIDKQLYQILRNTCIENKWRSGEVI